MNIKIPATVFYDGRGFVTDFTEPITLTAADGGINITLPRYGVWKRVNGKQQVVMVTDNLDDAIAKAKE